MSKKRDGIEERVVFEGSPEEVDAQMRKYSRRGVIWSGLAALAALAGWKWLISRPKDGSLPDPFRSALRTNESLFGGLFRSGSRTREYPLDTPVQDRVNGDVGLGPDFDPKEWTLSLETDSTKPVTMEMIRSLPRREMVTELRCIEGWSAMVHWSGVRFSDFVDAYAPDSKSKSFVGIATPDGGYYVGLDMKSAMHGQTLLCFEMNGAPLSVQHGAPLRLVIPTKYGVKNIKRIGTIRLSDERPPDYWAERGYDWYCGL